MSEDPARSARVGESRARVATETVRVNLGERSYDIVIAPGLLSSAGRLVARRHAGRRAMIVADETVAGLHLDPLRDSLSGAGIRATAIAVPAGEGSKSFEMLGDVVDAILEARLERGDLVVALGGGVVGDLAGFAAAIARRGMPFVQVPTTLLAQVDSSVGGKTGINTRHGKNLVGAFHQPDLVVIDTDVLATLPARELRAGYAEVAKYAFIDDPDLFFWLERRFDDVLALGPALPATVAKCCEAKARVVAADERESGPRALLNLGHTFGHGLEALGGFDGTILHGEAVAIGMAMAFRYSVRCGLCPEEDARTAIRHLERAGLPTAVRHVPDLPADRDGLFAAMLQDKKTVRGALRLILVRGIGEAFVCDTVDTGDLLNFLEDELSS